MQTCKFIADILRTIVTNHLLAFVLPAFVPSICLGLITTDRKCFSVHGMDDLSLLDINNFAGIANPSTGVLRSSNKLR